ncbi:hypothetical protein BsWGS_20728 [Bradybaena similaris]
MSLTSEEHALISKNFTEGDIIVLHRWISHAYSAQCLGFYSPVWRKYDQGVVGFCYHYKKHNHGGHGSNNGVAGDSVPRVLALPVTQSACSRRFRLVVCVDSGWRLSATCWHFQ